MIALGYDAAGRGLMEEIKAHLAARGLAYKDFGSGGANDYPVPAGLAAAAVLSGECARGILICGTGIGISIAANRHPGIRCALCHDVFSAKAARRHNDANMLAMGGRVIGAGPAIEIVDAWLDAAFSGAERHVRRIGLIDANLLSV